MVNRATVERDNDALFVKDGVPVKFCFHRSVTQGRDQITRNVERHGGQIVAKERLANVLLVDEQEDLALFRRRYYSSTEAYRLSLYVEPRGFVQACIRAGTCHHVGPVKQGMPGRAPAGGGVAGRGRVPFTEADRDHLAYYLATRCPTRDGRMGNNAYKDLERLGQTEDRSWTWARRHTFHSWREHYKMNPQMMDARIDYYVQRLKHVGHHFGHDPRRHDRWEELQEEEEGEGDDEEQGRGLELQDRGRREQVRPAPAERRSDRAARDYLARHEQDLVTVDEEEGDDTQEDAIQKPRRVKRHRIHPDAHRQRNIQGTQAKRTRVAETSTNEKRTSRVEADRGEGSSTREEGTDQEESSEEIEGSDIFGDRAYEDESRFDFDDATDFAVPFSPRASPAPEQDGPPLSTQATLVASPRSAQRERTVAQAQTPTKVAKTTLKPTVPPQQTSAVTQERVAVQRARVRGASVQPGAMQEAPEDEMVRDDVDEEGIGSEEGEDDEEGENSDREEVEDILKRIPRYQVMEDPHEPSDSDDAETHASLVQGVIREGSADMADASEGDETRTDKDSDDDDADRIEQMAGVSLVASERRVTRSMVATQKQIETQRTSPRQTRSENKARAALQPTAFPSPGTKARAVVDRFREEERRIPYAPPPGTRAAKAAKGMGR